MKTTPSPVRAIPPPQRSVSRSLDERNAPHAPRPACWLRVSELSGFPVTKSLNNPLPPPAACSGQREPGRRQGPHPRLPHAEGAAGRSARGQGGTAQGWRALGLGTPGGTHLPRRRQAARWLRTGLGREKADIPGAERAAAASPLPVAPAPPRQGSAPSLPATAAPPRPRPHPIISSTLLRPRPFPAAPRQGSAPGPPPGPAPRQVPGGRARRSRNRGLQGPGQSLHANSGIETEF